MNRVIVITGATSGIGKACAEKFSNLGDIVYCLSRSEKEDDFHKACDISDENQVAKVVSEIGKKHQKIDIVVNNAGCGISGALEFSDMDAVRSMFDVNLFGTMNIIKHALPYMTKGSKFINISSTCALFPVPFRSVYCATKSALNMISYGLQMECRSAGIQVSIICPGEVKTNFSKNRNQNFQTNERYGERIKNASDRIEHNYDKRMPAEKLAEVVVKQANKKKCKLLTIVGCKFKCLYFASKFVPSRFFINKIEKFMGGHKKI